MSVSRGANNYSFGFTYPCLIYNYMDERQKKVKVDLLVQLLEPDQFSIKFNDTGAENLVSTRLLDFFTNTNRLAIIDTKLNANPSKVVTFEKCVTKLGVDTDHAEDIFCPPPLSVSSCHSSVIQKIPIEPEAQFFESWRLDTGKADHRNAHQYYIVLMVELEAAEKPRIIVTQKRMKVFEKPTR